MRRSMELKKYFAVLPAFRGIYNDISYMYDDVVSRTVSNPYKSSAEPCMSLEQITVFLQRNKLIVKTNTNLALRYWPGDKEVKGETAGN